MKILFNARIYTLDPTLPQASVLVIESDRVRAVGGDELLESFGLFAERVDLGGRVILPGLADAHLHLQQYAFTLQKVDVETSSKAEALRRVADRARRLPAGEWVLGHGWQQDDWDGQFPSAAELDAVIPDQPVFLTAKSMHMAWVNSKALQIAQININTPDPLNGKIGRDSSGQPNGCLFESALQFIKTILPEPPIEKTASAIQAAQSNLIQMGLTHVHDFDRRTAFQALQGLDQEGLLKLRVVKSLPLELLDYASGVGLRTGFGSRHLTIGSVKAFMDGALSPRTAAMLAPYEGEPDNQGILNLDAEQLSEYGRRAAESGLSLAVHAIGDRAVHEVLDAFEQLRSFEHQRHLPNLRHRIEHVQVIHPNDASRLAKLGLIASMQPIHATSDMNLADRFWGERARLSYAWRTQLEAGAVLAFGSDAPVENPNPFLGLYAAVTRRRANGSPNAAGWRSEQRLSFGEALHGFTSGAAYAAGLERKLGKLSPDYFADLIVLDENPFTCPPETLLTLKPDSVMLGGEWVLPTD